MLPLRPLLLAALIPLTSGPSLAAEPAADKPYDVNAKPLSNREFGLLFRSSYTIRQDGTVWAPGAGQPVLEREMPYVVEKLISGQRLKALLTLNLILSRSQGEKKLTADERESIRRVVRADWAYLSYETRKDFKDYFNRDELDAMDADSPLPRAPLAPRLLHEDDDGAEAPEPSAPGPQAQGPKVQASERSREPMPEERVPMTTPDPNAPEPPVLDLTVPGPSAPGPRVQVAAAEPSPAPPSVPVAPPLMTPLGIQRQAAPPGAAGKATAASEGPLSGVPAGMTAEEFERLARPKPPQPPPAPEPKAPPPGPSAPGPQVQVAAHPQTEPSPTALVAEVTAEEFSKFLVDAPCSRQVRDILKMVSDHAPRFAKDRSLSLVMTLLPRIAVDSVRSGRGIRAWTESPRAGQPASVILSPGPVIFERKKLFFKGAEVLLSQSPDAYHRLGLPVPGLKAVNRESVPSRTDISEWGSTLRFDDGSSRGSFTPEAQAGTLLAALLELDMARRGQDASPYASALFARTAQMMLYASVAKSLKTDEFLDPETRASYRQWTRSPSEFRDHILHTLSAGQAGLVDPRRAGPAQAELFGKTMLSSCRGKAGQEVQASAAADAVQPGGRASRPPLGWASAAADSKRLQARALKSAGLVDARQLDESLAYIEKTADPLTAGPGAGAPADRCRRLEGELQSLRRSALLMDELVKAERAFRP
ncbi:MAG: hypothetical protein HY748_04825 [Elusimicrobia bacterium]|nr:hypothetical protein [Elusimicrobiota bacterium]